MVNSAGFFYLLQYIFQLNNKGSLLQANAPFPLQLLNAVTFIHCEVLEVCEQEPP